MVDSDVSGRRFRTVPRVAQCQVFALAARDLQRLQLRRANLGLWLVLVSLCVFSLGILGSAAPEIALALSPMGDEAHQTPPPDTLSCPRGFDWTEGFFAIFSPCPRQFKLCGSHDQNSVRAPIQSDIFSGTAGLPGPGPDPAQTQVRHRTYEDMEEGNLMKWNNLIGGSGLWPIFGGVPVRKKQTATKVRMTTDVFNLASRPPRSQARKVILPNDHDFAISTQWPLISSQLHVWVSFAGEICIIPGSAEIKKSEVS